MTATETNLAKPWNWNALAKLIRSGDIVSVMTANGRRRRYRVDTLSAHMAAGVQIDRKGEPVSRRGELLRMSHPFWELTGCWPGEQTLADAYAEHAVRTVRTANYPDPNFPEHPPRRPRKGSKS